MNKTTRLVNQKRSYQAHEVFTNSVIMWFKMYGRIIGYAIVTYVALVTVLVLLFKGSSFAGKIIGSYWLLGKSLVLLSIGLSDMFRGMKLVTWKALSETWFIMLICTPVFGLIPVAIRYFKERSAEHGQKIHHRGAKEVEPAELMKTIRADEEKTSLPIGEIKLPVSAETKHTFFVGAPGTGKTVCMSAIIKTAMDRRERGIIYDTKGDFIPRFFDPSRGDIIINPVDTRCAGWTIFNDIKTTLDIDTVAGTIIPETKSSDPYWYNAARDVLAGVLHHISQQDDRSNRAIWELLSLPTDEIASRLFDTRGAERGFKHIEKPDSKQTASVMSVLMSYAKCFEMTTEIEGDFSVNEWIRNGTGWVYLPNYTNIREAVKPLLTLFITLSGVSLLSLDDDRNRRIFFFLDEIGTLHKIPIIESFLTQSRSKGGSIWLGTQDKGQLEKIYGRESRETIINSCGNLILFRASDQESAEYFSRSLGDAETEEEEFTRSIGISDNKDGESFTSRKQVERLVLPSEIMGLPNLTAYVRVAGYPEITKTRIEYQHYPSTDHKAFDAITTIMISDAKNPDNTAKNNDNDLTNSSNYDTKTEKEKKNEN